MHVIQAARHAAASACIVFPRMSPPSRWPPPSSARDTTAVSGRARKSDSSARESRVAHQPSSSSRTFARRSAGENGLGM
jgi:hypothetical protein